MAGTIFTSPGVFANSADMPQVSTIPVTPIPGALADWAANQLSGGAVAAWPDLIGDYALTAPSASEQHPAVIGTGLERYVSFDGINDRIDVSIPLAQPVTAILVARLPNLAGSQHIMTGGTGPASFNLGVNSNASSWIASNGSNRTFGSTPDNGWHIFILSFNGANSALSLDGVETIANPGTGGSDRIRLGASSSTYYPTDLRRLAILPYAAQATERAAIYRNLADYYGM